MVENSVDVKKILSDFWPWKKFNYYTTFKAPWPISNPPFWLSIFFSLAYVLARVHFLLLDEQVFMLLYLCACAVSFASTINSASLPLIVKFYLVMYSSFFTNLMKLSLLPQMSLKRILSINFWVTFGFL